jgi:GntR family transcriptional repressor for pyruvate dehydrogenase complex
MDKCIKAKAITRERLAERVIFGGVDWDVIERSQDVLSLEGNTSERIFRDLRHRILVGEFEAGEKLPPERELASYYNTNRNTLREAIKRLEQIKLVSVKQGSGLRVMDYRREASLEILGAYLQSVEDGEERRRVISDLLNARTHILELTVKLASERAEVSDLAKLKQIQAHQELAFKRGDTVALARGDLAFVDALVSAAESLTARWVANTFIEIYRNLLNLFIDKFPLLWMLQEEYINYIKELIAALEHGEADRAVSLTHNYYTETDAQLKAKLESISADLEL